jgi:hypothetical protein
MHFSDLTRAEKISMLGVTATLWAKGIVEIPNEGSRLEPEEILDGLADAADEMVAKASCLNARAPGTSR